MNRRVRIIPQGVLVFKNRVGVLSFCLVDRTLNKVVQRTLPTGLLQPLADTTVHFLLRRFLPGLLRGRATGKNGSQQHAISKCQFHKVLSRGKNISNLGTNNKRSLTGPQQTKHNSACVVV